MSRHLELTKKSINPADAVVDTARLREIICESVQAECVSFFGRQLRAVIVTGSVARGEASFVRTEGLWEVRGDAEFMVVLEKNVILPLCATLGTLRQRIEKVLHQRTVRCTVELSAVHPAYFRQLPPHIFTYELKHCGRVIWGDDRILELIPKFSVDDLSLEDAWRLLCNRLLEVLECMPEPSHEENPTPAKLSYRILKLNLDMATSLLVFVRAYAPTYRERQEILRRLADQTAQAGKYPFELVGFADHVANCTDEKLAPPWNTHPPLDLSWRDAICTAHSLWRWELDRLVGIKEPLSDRKLFDQWMRAQPLGARIRGWAYVLRARGWYKSYREWPHWLRLCWKASPRYCVYRAACELLFQSFDPDSARHEQAENACWNDLYDWLPVVSRPEINGKGSSWLRFASVIVTNYQEFLIGTRA